MSGLGLSCSRAEPTNYIQGQELRLLSAQFADDLVVFENLRYGNAVYLLYQNWDDVSRHRGSIYYAIRMRILTVQFTLKLAGSSHGASS
jgi:hypothetical protein